MNWEIVILRLVHIIGGVFWAGSSFVFAGFIEPTARRGGPEGGRFVQRLATQTPYSLVLGVAALLTTLAGAWLFWLDSGRLNPAWLGTGTGLALTLGGAAGIGAAMIGFAVQFRSTSRLKALAGEITGGAPSASQAQELNLLQGRLRAGGRWLAALLAVAVVAMASARYLTF